MTTRTTRAEARLELFETIADALPHRPVYQWSQAAPEGPYVVIENPGMQTSETEWTWPVRIYARASEPTMAEAQEQLDILADEVETALHGYTFTMSPDAYITEQDLYMVELFVDIPRQDF